MRKLKLQMWVKRNVTILENVSSELFMAIVQWV